MLPASRYRVPLHSSAEANAAIRQRTAASLRHHARHPEEIAERIEELDREWDVERALEANAASISLVGLALAGGVDRRWMILPFAVAAFLLQHALQGWCPPLPVLRQMGFRTRAEIDSERYALKAIRGDFNGMAEARDRARAAQNAVSS